MQIDLEGDSVINGGWTVELIKPIELEQSVELEQIDDDSENHEFNTLKKIK